jgi:hypothetical protein
MSDKNRPPAPEGSPIADRRAEFERITRLSARDVNAERAFLESKIEILESDPTLGGPQKAAELAKLRQMLDKLPPRRG